MSHFYANLEGSRGEATRQGTKSSGMYVHIRGWDLGVKVVAGYNEKTGKDEFAVYRTAGSNGRKPKRLITVVKSI